MRGDRRAVGVHCFVEARRLPGVRRLVGVCSCGLHKSPSLAEKSPSFLVCRIGDLFSLGGGESLVVRVGGPPPFKPVKRNRDDCLKRGSRSPATETKIKHTSDGPYLNIV